MACAGPARHRKTGSTWVPAVAATLAGRVAAGGRHEFGQSPEPDTRLSIWTVSHGRHAARKTVDTLTGRCASVTSSGAVNRAAGPLQPVERGLRALPRSASA